jgi:choline dehydrogenase-like flavoprotein
MLLPWLALLVASTTATDYDHIDVSEGTSGLVAANRLSEKPFVLVLVIEAGP